MTEEEWLAHNNPRATLEFVKGKVSDRKLRLFAVACCNRIRHLMVDQRSQAATHLAEQFADGLISQRERREMYRMIQGYAQEFGPDEAAAATLHRLAFYAASESSHWSAIVIGAAADFNSSAADHIAVGHRERDCEWIRQLGLLHDIAGNPFKPVAFDPNWHTSDVTAMARGMYETRDFAAMPILADALQDAGCVNADVLDHCRGPGPHVRGCWVVDHVLGKA